MRKKIEIKRTLVNKKDAKIASEREKDLHEHFLFEFEE